ncbi:MAPEG family protein [Pseudidiomarina taiwanensis]|uniref:MAPEG family protein n=1 Tax=Pseudidiomarina taiwanensis TaxID=337250 RepID=A0A432ZL26_9GAMM|nr:MAPEG family protein [Pseudidiomarina taiwanensis]RUO78623.1 hypothetical protein CWI83_06290 [Pseudidiomarina taiwanensis]
MGTLIWSNETGLLVGLTLIVLMVVVQWIIGSAVKARSAGAIPGKIDESLSHDSFVFRAHRTFMNSLESVPVFLITALLAMFAQVDAQWLTTWVWVFFVARLLHMVLYYAIATEQNPSPRSYFFLIGLVAQVALLVHLFTTILD